MIRHKQRFARVLDHWVKIHRNIFGATIPSLDLSLSDLQQAEMEPVPLLVQWVYSIVCKNYILSDRIRVQRLNS